MPVDAIMSIERAIYPSQSADTENGWIQCSNSHWKKVTLFSRVNSGDSILSCFNIDS